MRFRHAAGLSARDLAALDEFHQLQHVAADAAPEAVPALLVEPDVKRPVGLALVIWAIALERVPRLPGDPAGQQLAGDLGDVHIGDLAVVGVDVDGSRAAHTWAPWLSRKERKVFRRSTWRFLAQLSMPHRSPRMIADSLARVTAV